MVPTRRLPALLACLSILLASPSLVFAQENDRDVPSREIEANRKAQEAAKSSSELASLESGETVAYQDILRDPDNLQLNYRYARAQVDRGDYLGASATLERILLIDPSLADVRLFYAIVLYRLDNLSEAEQQFQLARAGDIPDTSQREIDEYLHEIHQRHKTTRFSTTLSMGWGYDTNRNSAPSSKEIFFANTPFPLTGSSRKRKDTQFLLVHNISAAHDIGQTGHQWIGSYDAFVGEQTVVDDLDIHSFAFETGFLLKTRLGEFTPTGSFDHLLLSRETYLRNMGAKVAWHKDLGLRWALDAEPSWSHEQYRGISESAAARERTGDMIAFTGGPSYLLSPTMKLTGIIGYENKDAKANYNAYEGYSFGGQHTWVLPVGQFLVSSLIYTENIYNEPDYAISPHKRTDRQFRARATYGAPITLFVTDHLLPEWVTKDLTASFSVEQFRAISTITNYTYTNSKVSGMLTKRVEF